MRTFYIAGSSVRKRDIAQLAHELYCEFGLTWQGGWDWTAFDDSDLGSLSTGNGILARAGAIAGDYAAAIGADLFVFVLDAADPQKGGHAELGARVSHNKLAHIIMGCAADHLFYRHPLVKRHRTWAEFKAWLGHRPR